MSDRLRSLGFRKAGYIPKKDHIDQLTLENVVGGQVVQNSLGEFVLKDTLYPLDYQHGIISLDTEVETGTINRAARINTERPALEKLLFIDTETSGLSGGAGTFAFLVGYGRFTKEGFLLSQVIMRDPVEEPAMLLHLMNQIGREYIFVSFNGKSFDIPLLQNRLVMNRLPMKLREIQHLDLLHISRKLWRRSLDSCALKDLESAILKFERTSEDVPGWMIPDIYFAFLRTGDPSGLKEVVYHNAQDIVSLAALFIHITTLLEKNVAIETVPIDDLIAISRIYWDLGSYETSASILQSTLLHAVDAKQQISVNSLLGKYYKKIGDLQRSQNHWKFAAENGDITAGIELAMYYEHTKKDPSMALEWCEKALVFCNTGENNANNAKYIMDLHKRIKRLQQKRRNDV
ncbi:MAG TPA: ribonuclease H-like domain-containing protein [Anaerolineaceae bacterium]|nr:ribonuclease H-like domain-containing protein [Anaerolineaceae bacterium]